MNNIKTFFAYDPKDTTEIGLEKFATFLVAGSCTLAGCIWTVMYYAIFGLGLTALMPALFVIIVGVVMIISHIKKKHHYVIYAQIICIIYIPFLIQWSIGGAFDSGFVLAWAFVGPICALMFFSVKQSVPWFLLYLLNLAITVIFNDYFAGNAQVVTENIKLIFFLMNLGFASTIVFIFASYYVNAAVREQKKVNKLLEANLQQQLVLQENEKLATLGKLSAGVAHELNNPASATQRSAEQLQDAVLKLGQAEFTLGKSNLSTLQLNNLAPHTQLIEQRAKEPLHLDPLNLSDQENEIETWLEEHGVEDAWKLAAMLVKMGYSCPMLSDLSKDFSNQEFSTIAALLSHKYIAHNLIEEIGRCSNRITEIVKALKSYSYLDRAPVQSIDIHEGLNNTLVMLRSILKDRIRVRQEYAQNLPRIEAFGGDLNQVWTNIINNAVSAMSGQGEIVLKTYQEDTWIVVEIRDNGPGIPLDVQDKIFDPFFTTKPPGEGRGLGLNISHNIIAQKHNGRLSVDSKPGATCFKVKLPLQIIT